MALAAVAGGLAAAAYLDGKYQLRRDLSIVKRVKGAEHRYNQVVKQDRISAWYNFAEVCQRHSHEQAIWSRAGNWTFGELHDQTTRYAQWLLEVGIRPGDLVGLYLFNSAEFIMLVFACHCIGAAPALFNYNLEGKALIHCLDVCESKVLIVDSDAGCQARIAGVREYFESKGTITVTLDESLKQDVSARPAVVPEDTWRNGVQGDFPFCLIFTSGTTGMPKGCPFNLDRMHRLGQVFSPLVLLLTHAISILVNHLEPPFNCKPGVDCWYNSMPLYHGTGLISIAAMLLTGVSVAFAPRFSVSGFWPDIHDSGATAFIYVGETVRYLLNAPSHPLERKHKLRLAYGNGLRPDVWTKFQTRFGVPEVAEFFNSSEGVFGLMVWDRGPYLQGCVGHHGGLMRMFLRNRFVPVLIDHDTGDIWRDVNTGFAKRMDYDEGGEILVAVPDRKAFGGYWKNDQATNKKFVTDVFKKGDLYYRSGDALRRSGDGHWYFMDRLGDTFRWKSENVSTAEVSEALGRFPGIAEANVYGVTVPNHEGRAGCAAIHLDPKAGVTAESLDYSELLQFARKELPGYAVPIFLRIVKESSHIHNHKQNKVLLRKEGVDPDSVGVEDPTGKGDVLLWLSPKGREKYVPFERSDWEALGRAEARL
ncbi:fatty-acyl-CoA synthase [Pseudomassariella vexata]|uniref:Fatty-acyl-CoA synthase n=1 Tax=Pseudomassariella vexata TaxID=1141098 RepID=A0A1Y2DFS5_9PEZI|nr:fatty-acyl-CoA synthase [Pseudomassariella vexata]ORY58047.1 fatty-acyl-CoA synthase [Pseudomassariella vexata]